MSDVNDVVPPVDNLDSEEENEEQVNRPKRSFRKWSDDVMMELVERINKGEKYQDVTKDTLVPISTLWTRVKGMYGGDLRPKTGAPSLFSEEFEAEIALFVAHCRLLRIPRSRKLLKEDIAHYVAYGKFHIPKLQPTGPGRSWFDRFLTLWSDFAELLNRGQIAKIENDPISIRTWIHERDNYTRLYRQPKRYATKKYIFVAEMIVLEISRKNLMQYCVVFIYNAEGDLLKPLILHDGDMTPFILDFYASKFTFCKTDKGLVDRTAVCAAFDNIYKFLQKSKMQHMPIVYMVPTVSQGFGLYLWKQCVDSRFMVQTVPNNIYRYLRTVNMGLAEKLVPEFQRVADKNFIRPNMELSAYSFMDVMRQVFELFTCRTHLRNTCRRLRIVYLWKEPPQDENTDQPDAVQNLELEANGYDDLSYSDLEEETDLPVVKLERS